MKVGGSLYDLPDLGPRLRDWLARLGCREVVLVPGGGAAADVVRDLDRAHGLGEETAHWLALRAVSLNARFLASLLPSAVVSADLDAWPGLWAGGTVPVLDAHAFAAADDGRPGCLPHHWGATSDAVAARLAVVVGAARLVLLKSVTVPDGTDWARASRRGIVDEVFAGIVACHGLEVRAVNLRE